MTRLVAALLALTLVAVACGDDASDDAGGDAPERIVSLSATATETLFAIGAGDLIVAVDNFSNHPANDLPAVDSFSPNVEVIAEFDPDLVVISFDPGDLVSGLDRLGIETLMQGAAPTIGDAYAQIEQLGAATGHTGDAAELVGQIRTDLDRLVADAPDGSGVTYYHELDDTGFTLDSSTLFGEIYGLFGLENVADGGFDGYGVYPEEELIVADPDLIFLADTLCCGQSAETVSARPGWDQLVAVTGDGVIELDDDIASRWGPRIVDFATAIASALDGVAAPA